ncbi:MAG TPA: hypothetical protein VND66_01965 [Acidobacteriaceae bacterium]|nr:hypothetical protein [Acidobacteriaceae bacterium]
MQVCFDHRACGLSQGRWRSSAATLICVLSVTTTGCLSTLSKHAVAVSVATAPVVNQAAAAYQSAEALHDLREDYDAVAEFDASAPVYNPRNIKPLMSDEDIQVRLAVLEALKCYAESLVPITSGTSSPELDAASASAGNSISTLGNSLAPAIESTLGVASASAATTTTVTTISGGRVTTTSSTSSVPPSPAITPEVQNLISTAVNALGQFLVSKKVKKELPQKIKEMDPHIDVLCKLLEQDLDTLQEQEQRDYNRIINQQTLFIRQTTALDPQERREQIMKLPQIVRQQHASEAQLVELHASLAELAMVHHALATAAVDNNPESLSSKLGDLGAAGKNLGTFYRSLPTQ